MGLVGLPGQRGVASGGAALTLGEERVLLRGTDSEPYVHRPSPMGPARQLELRVVRPAFEPTADSPFAPTRAASRRVPCVRIGVFVSW